MTTSSKSRTLRLGTRGSALARAQAELVTHLLQVHYPDFEVQIVVIRTEGDIDKRSPLTVIGGRGVFTSALQTALLQGEIDAAVHSAKDLPSSESDGLRFAAFLAREDPRDVLVTRHGCSLAELPASPVLGTSSRRRATQVRHARPDAQIVELRGNVDTRLTKAMSGDLDGIVIAAAGVTRMGWQDQISEYLPLDHFVPAPGQGALAIEVRANDELGNLVDALADRAGMQPVEIERAFLRSIGAGCTTPIGAHVSIADDGFVLRCMLASDDGSRAEWRTVRLSSEDAETAAAALSRELLGTIQGSGNGSRKAELSLQGKVVVVTRPIQDAADMERMIVLAGGEALSAPTIKVEPVAFGAAGISELMKSGHWDWVVFTSRNAVDAFVTGVLQHGPVAESFSDVNVAAIGDVTADALHAHGVAVDLVSPSRTGRDLGMELGRRGVDGVNVLLPQGNLNRPELVDILQAQGAVAETVQVYAIRGEEALPPAFAERLDRGEIDAITFTSPSSVREFLRLHKGGPAQLTHVVIGCIGDTTATEARALGLDWCVTATRPGISELLESIATALELREGKREEGIPA